MMQHLTDAQREAVTFDAGNPKNLLILACAGSGKTETLGVPRRTHGRQWDSTGIHRGIHLY